MNIHFYLFEQKMANDAKKIPSKMPSSSQVIEISGDLNHENRIKGAYHLKPTMLCTVLTEYYIVIINIQRQMLITINACSYKILIDFEINEPNWKGVSWFPIVRLNAIQFDWHLQWKYHRRNRWWEKSDLNNFDWILTLNANPCKYLHSNCFCRTMRFVCWTRCHCENPMENIEQIH